MPIVSRINYSVTCFYFKSINETILCIWSSCSHHWWIRRTLNFSVILHWYNCRGLSMITRQFVRLHGIISNFIGRLISIFLIHDVNAVKETDQGQQGKGYHDNDNTNPNNMKWFHFKNDSTQCYVLLRPLITKVLACQMRNIETQRL